MENYGLDAVSLSTRRAFVEQPYVTSHSLTQASDAWTRVKYMVFDAPCLAHEPVELRWSHLGTLLPTAASDTFDTLEVRRNTHFNTGGGVSC